jgi:hypothetical protein
MVVNKNEISNIKIRDILDFNKPLEEFLTLEDIRLYKNTLTDMKNHFINKYKVKGCLDYNESLKSLNKNNKETIFFESKQSEKKILFEIPLIEFLDRKVNIKELKDNFTDNLKNLEDEDLKILEVNFKKTLRRMQKKLYEFKKNPEKFKTRKNLPLTYNQFLYKIVKEEISFKENQIFKFIKIINKEIVDFKFKTLDYRKFEEKITYYDYFNLNIRMYKKSSGVCFSNKKLKIKNGKNNVLVDSKEKYILNKPTFDYFKEKLSNYVSNFSELEENGKMYNFKWYLLNHLKNFSNETNIRKIIFLEKYLKNQSEEDYQEYGRYYNYKNTSFMYKFKQFNYKFMPLKMQTDENIINFNYFKYSTEFKKIKYIKNIESPYQLLLENKYKRRKYNITESENLFINNIIEYLDVKGYGNINFEDISLVYNTLLKIKSKNKSIYNFLLEEDNFIIFSHRKEISINIDFYNFIGNHINFFNSEILLKYKTNIIEHNLQNIITLEHLCFYKNSDKSIINLKNYKKDGKEKHHLIPFEDNHNLMIKIKSENAEFFLNYFLDKNKLYIYKKYLSNSIKKDILFDIEKDILKFSNKIEKFKKVIKINKFSVKINFLLLMFILKFDNKNTISDRLLDKNNLLFKNKNVKDTILNTFYSFYRDVSLLENGNTYNYYHNFQYSYLDQITSLLMSKMNIKVVNKLLHLIKQESSLSLFSNMNLNFITQEKNMKNIDNIESELLKCNSFQKFNNIFNKKRTEEFKTKLINKKLLNKDSDILTENKMNLIQSSNSQMDIVNYLSKNKHEENIIKKKNLKCGIAIELRGSEDIIGHIGSNVGGVCISTTSRERDSHLNKGYLNLIIRDNDKIYLWGLLLKVKHLSNSIEIKTEEDIKNIKEAFLLNNLQGSLGTKYKKNKIEIRNEIQNIISSLELPAFTKNRGFNSIEFNLKNKNKQSFIIEKHVRHDFSNKRLIKEKKQILNDFVVIEENLLEF